MIFSENFLSVEIFPEWNFSRVDSVELFTIYDIGEDVRSMKILKVRM
jgi:hypothetical protein